MNTFKKRMLVAAIIAGLAVIGSLMNSQQSTVRAAGGPMVTIDPTQLPLPVQGSLGVSGSVAATQSDPWSVGITGTPDVTVANPATAPVLALNVSDPGRIAYQAQSQGNCGVNFCQVDFPPVPAKHRLVVQHTTVNLYFNGPPINANIDFDVNGPNQPIIFSRFNTTDTGLDINLGLTVFDREVLFYVDAGQNVHLGINPSNGGNVSNANFLLTGYMLDCSIGPCAAIAP